MRGAFVGLAVMLVLEAGCSSAKEPARGPEVEATEIAAAKPAEPAKPAEAQPAEGLCPLGDGEWKACDGKRVRLEGRAPMMVMQHPVVAMGPPGEPQHQDYLELANGAQIIVVSKKRVDCSGAMVVTGTLRSIDLGGEPGTKNSYRGWQVADAEVECR